uniref:Apoptosis-antagonizing transcription factor C-terminal domain-containing protein n=1 Tax=Daucus carota subsp. sativus TaxID=79200 RepID=A0A175YEX3_DAUCS
MKRGREADSEDDVFTKSGAETLDYVDSEGDGSEFDSDGLADHESDGDEDNEDDDSNGDEDDEISGEEEVEDDEEMENTENEKRNIAEVEEVEKEYIELRQEEQMEDILPGPISQVVILDNSYHVSTDVWEGVDRGPLECICGDHSSSITPFPIVTCQVTILLPQLLFTSALWDKTLELRFLLQKAFSNSNRLPQDPIRSSFCDSYSETSEAYSDLITTSKKTLDSIQKLQEALLEKNPTITQGADGTSGKNTKQLKASENLIAEEDQEWSKISEMQSRIVSFRNKSVDKWQRRTQVTTGATAIKGKLQAFNQSISDQVSAYMRDPSRMVNGMQQRRSAIAIFGTDPETSNITKEEEVNGDPELLDDSEFYQQLLKEFFETIDPTSSEAAFYALKRMQTKKRKVVDQRASKSRKIRYHVLEKIVNFMAPRSMNLPPVAPKLFENLFGLKVQKAA